MIIIIIIIMITIMIIITTVTIIMRILLRKLNVSTARVVGARDPGSRDWVERKGGAGVVPEPASKDEKTAEATNTRWRKRREQ